MNKVPLALAVFLLLAPSAARADSAPSIIFIGDSHSVGKFGPTLDDLLRGVPNAKVATYAVCGSRPQSWISESEIGCGWFFRDPDEGSKKWLRTRKEQKDDGKGGKKTVTYIKTPSFAQLMADHAPTAVIVELGANGLSDDSVKNLLDRIHSYGAMCFWVGPPNMRNQGPKEIDGFYTTLKRAGIQEFVKPAESRGDGCVLFDSRLDKRAYLKYPDSGGDGTHFYGFPGADAMAEQWGRDAGALIVPAVTP